MRRLITVILFNNGEKRPMVLVLGFHHIIRRFTQSPLCIKSTKTLKTQTKLLLHNNTTLSKINFCPRVPPAHRICYDHPQSTKKRELEQFNTSTPISYLFNLLSHHLLYFLFSFIKDLVVEQCS